ncbi:MAG TPA: GAF domain-containing protein [Nitrospiria bacterium]|jgi:transcriptional regulator with GAF, ATPase, and Fis domain|nr:GAF domain-containing protein [Nitrospiria bacterium]
MKMTPVEKKRWELWGISLFLLLTSGATVVIFGLITQQSPVKIVFLGIFILLFCAYIIMREFKLQKLQQQLQEEQTKVLEEEIRISSLESRLKELTGLQKAMMAIGMETEPEKALTTILRSALDFFAADRGSIMLVDETSQRLLIAAAIGLKPEYIAKGGPKIGEGIAGHVVQTGEALLLSPQVKTEQYKNFEMKETELRSSICAPLRSRHKIIGVMNYSITNPKKRLFTEYDLKLLTIFAQYAILVIDAAKAARLR